MKREVLIIIMSCILAVTILGTALILNPPYKTGSYDIGAGHERAYMYNVYTGNVWLLENGEKVSGKSLAEIRELREESGYTIKKGPLPPVPPPPAKPGLLEQYRKPE